MAAGFLGIPWQRALRVGIHIRLDPRCRAEATALQKQKPDCSLLAVAEPLTLGPLNFELLNSARRNPGLPEFERFVIPRLFICEYNEVAFRSRGLKVLISWKNENFFSPLSPG